MRKLHINRNVHSQHQLMLHLVFVTKYRRNVLKKEHEPKMFFLFREICQSVNCDLIHLGSDGDHVHLMVEMATTISVSDLVQRLKGVSSRRWVEVDESNNRFYWSRSYFAKTVGHMTAANTWKYTENQGLKRA